MDGKQFEASSDVSSLKKFAKAARYTTVYHPAKPTSVSIVSMLRLVYGDGLMEKRKGLRCKTVVRSSSLLTTLRRFVTSLNMQGDFELESPCT
jgi:hypothetical protein